MDYPQFFIWLLITLPFVVAVLETVFAIRVFRGRKFRRALLFLDFLGFALAVFGISIGLKDTVVWEADWYVQLYSNQAHTVLATEHRLSILVLSAFGFISYLFLSIAPIKKLPPLLRVLSLSGTYIGIFTAILVIVQILSIHPLRTSDIRSAGFSSGSILFLEIPWILLIVHCLLLIAARTSFFLVRESKDLLVSENSSEENSAEPDASLCEFSQKLQRLRRFLMNSNHWPFLAALYCFPLIGIISMILMLFGQSPIAAIKAFTETADWTFSTKIPPQSLFYDEHYLCTVAAGGHKRIVKPLRMGIRHGHPVVVNRQLQIANAFEQVLEERTPKLHRAVRGFYDKYGFPVAKLIRTKLAADIVYILMKPLEWFFLITLYLSDTHPEDRICIQYTGKKKEDFL